MARLTKHQTQFQTALKTLSTHSAEGILTYLKQHHWAQFQSNVDAVFTLNINPKRAEHNLKGIYQLPHALVNQKRICIFTTNHRLAAEKLKVHLVGGVELIERIIQSKQIDFEIAIATPEIVPQLAKLGRILGPKKLMPSQKTATITTDLAKTVANFQQGQFQFQVDSGGNLHLQVGKISQSVDQLKANFEYLVKYVNQLKPPFVKKRYVKQISLSTTMSAGFKVDLNLL